MAWCKYWNGYLVPADLPIQTEKRLLSSMKLILTSFGHDRLPDFLTGRTLAYVPDASRSIDEPDFIETERETLRSQGFNLIDIPLSTTSMAEVDKTLTTVDALYVAGGETFDLLHVLRTTGADQLITKHVRAGLPYIGCSAGSIVAGPDIEAASIIDDPTVASLTSTAGLALTDFVVVPHAAGNLPPFPIDLIAKTVQDYGEKWPLILLRDGQALLIDDHTIQLV